MLEQRNLILAIVLSVAILFGFQYLYEKPRIKEQQARQAAQQQTAGETADTAPVAPGATDATVPGAAAPQVAAVSRQDALAAIPRIQIKSPRLSGSITRTGGRIDDLILTDYRETLAEGSPAITLLSPVGGKLPYYAEFGWTPALGESAPLPGRDTIWLADREVLTPGAPVTLSWDNGQGLIFERVFALDEDYMFTVTQRVTNNGDNPVNLLPYGLISRHGTPKTTGFYILHEGPLGVLNETLKEVDYDELSDSGRIEEKSTTGWVGITDKYWLTVLIPDQKVNYAASFNHRLAGDKDIYQIDYLRDPIQVAAGGTAKIEDRMFAGAKESALLDHYRDDEGVTRFDLAIDWGWFYFLTRPIFVAIDYFYGILGNFGLAILLLTVLIKLLFFPLAQKSYTSMSKMKKLQPEMLKLRERFGDDKQRLNQEMMALYKREKANPASGCLPIMIQIPVFFALYKVLFVTIEMRHAPFYGWIKDLSAPDPTTVFNLFGALPYTPPDFLMIGVWPLLMGGSMFLQQKLNPQPADPIQAKIFLFMPLFFMFLLANFPAGLVIYWTWNNVLSIAQQWVIMRRMGVKA